MSLVHHYSPQNTHIYLLFNSECERILGNEFESKGHNLPSSVIAKIRYHWGSSGNQSPADLLTNWLNYPESSWKFPLDSPSLWGANMEPTWRHCQNRDVLVFTCYSIMMCMGTGSDFDMHTLFIMVHRLLYTYCIYIYIYIYIYISHGSLSQSNRFLDRRHLGVRTGRLMPRAYCGWMWQVNVLVGKSDSWILTTDGRRYVYGSTQVLIRARFVLLNSLVPGMSGCEFKNAMLNLILLIGIFRPSDENYRRWMPWNVLLMSHHWVR